MGNDPGYSPGVTRAECFYLVDLLDFLDKISFGRPHTKPLLSANSICARIKDGQVSQKIRCQKMNLVVAACMMDSREGCVNLGRWIKMLLQHPQVEVLGA